MRLRSTKKKPKASRRKPVAKKPAANGRSNHRANGRTNGHAVRPIDQDAALVRRCLRGERAAWESLYRSCHPKLLAALRRYLAGQSMDENLAEELAARVWFQLVHNRSEMLARYDIERGCRLSTFLAAFARNEARAYYRSERRRQRREATACVSELQQQQVPIFRCRTELEEFTATLTRRELQFFRWCTQSLDERPVNGAAIFPDKGNNNDQLRLRVRRKLKSFLDAD